MKIYVEKFQDSELQFEKSSVAKANFGIQNELF